MILCAVNTNNEFMNMTTDHRTKTGNIMVKPSSTISHALRYNEFKYIIDINLYISKK